jgi:hypothetical protein
MPFFFFTLLLHELVLAHTAHRTHPIGRDILELRAGRDTVLLIAAASSYT